MMPGSDCNSCHRPGGSHDAPSFTISGTVYSSLTERDDCLGVSGASIRITDATGRRIELLSNRAGNFFLKTKSARIALPFQAEVTVAGKTRAMPVAQCEPSCNSCHSATGQSGAKGRIIVP